jgi:hypothetical protein
MAYGPEQHDSAKVIPYVGRCFLEALHRNCRAVVAFVDWVYVDKLRGGGLFPQLLQVRPQRPLHRRSGITPGRWA